MSKLFAGSPRKSHLVTLGSIEPADGVYDWTELDAASALAQANGKQWTVGVIWGIGCPQWVYNAGAVPVALTDGVMPTPWDPVLLAKELCFIRALPHATATILPWRG